MTDSLGLSIRLCASLPVGLATAFAARWLDRHLDVLLDRGLMAAIGTSTVRGRPSSWDPSLEIGATLLMGLMAITAESAVQRAAGMTLSAALFLCAWIDWRNHILPDLVVLPLLATGFLLATSCQPFVGAGQAFCGALLGWGLASVVGAAGRGVRGRMGGGDVKLLAAIGAWLGPVAVTIVLLISSIFMTLYIVLFKNRQNNIFLSFGPALAMVSIISMILIFMFPSAWSMPFSDAKADFAIPGTHRGVFKIGPEGTWVIYP